MINHESHANGVSAMMRKKADDANRKALFVDTDPQTLETIRSNAATTLKAIRKRLVMTQPQLANRMKVSFSSINHWETGHTFPRDEALLKISSLAKECGVPLIPLLTEQQQHTTDEEAVIRPPKHGKGPKPKKFRVGAMDPHQAIGFLRAFAATDFAGDHFKEPVEVVADYIARLENAIERVQQLYKS
jgi:DNA-binding transcriptional regulator YiaG